MNKLFSIALLALVLASCQDSDNVETTDNVSSDSTSFTTTAAPIADSNTQSIVTNSTVAPTKTVAPTITTVAPAAPVAKTATQGDGAAGLNPAHGAPGHRCDIAVGAPLNSPAGNTAAPAVNSAPAPTMSQSPPPAQPVNGKARLNPAHGEPGHDCSVAVGQPLKG